MRRISKGIKSVGFLCRFHGLKICPIDIKFLIVRYLKYYVIAF